MSIQSSLPSSFDRTSMIRQLWNETSTVQKVKAFALFVVLCVAIILTVSLVTNAYSGLLKKVFHIDNSILSFALGFATTLGIACLASKLLKPLIAEQEAN